MNGLFTTDPRVHWFVKLGQMPGSALLVETFILAWTCQVYAALLGATEKQEYRGLAAN